MTYLPKILHAPMNKWTTEKEHQELLKNNEAKRQFWVICFFCQERFLTKSAMQIRKKVCNKCIGHYS